MHSGNPFSNYINLRKYKLLGEHMNGSFHKRKRAVYTEESLKSQEDKKERV